MENVNVVIVDDNPMILNTLDEMISSEAGLSVIGRADNGKDAIDMIKDTEPDVVLLDLVMPRVDGITVVENIKKKTSMFKNPAFIILSAVGGEQMTEESFKAGANYFIMKPFDRDILVNKIRRIGKRPSRPVMGKVLEAPQKASTPEEEKYLETKDELLAKITTFMAGRAAEVLIFHSATSGAANDIENATKIARAMVTMYGMSDTFGMMCLATVENQYLDGRAGLICGEDTAGQIDKEVLSIINNSYNEAMQMLTENREILDHISEYLYEKETITGKEFMKIFREMKGLPQEEDKEALMPDDTEKDKKDSKAAFVSDDMFED